ncbi:2-keto-4-pentenoate hydratase, partial [Mycobacterium tuberculosis]
MAGAFVSARRQARPLADFPGPIPSTLGQSYAIQDAAIGLWGDEIKGWKVGRVAPELQDRVASSRIAGPIFAKSVQKADANRSLEVAVFEGGFAAVEAEFVFKLLEDAPRDKVSWTPEEAFELRHALHAGVEMAGSPLATINALGPTVVASDFGNNAGLVLGQCIPDWASFAPEALGCSTEIDGVCVGSASSAALPEGLLAAFAFLLGHAAARGFPLKAGQLVSSGAITGIHDICVGQTGLVSFGSWGKIGVV